MDNMPQQAPPREEACPTKPEDSAEALRGTIPSTGESLGWAAYGVYVRTDDAGRIWEINSDAFLADVTGWTQIDEGYGDRCHHAQGNYLPGPLWDDRGVCRYKLADGEAVERTQAEMDADYTPPVPSLTAEQRMGEIEAAMMELAAMMTTDTPGGDA